MVETSGSRIVLPRYAETQVQAIDDLLSLEPMDFPETSELKPTDVVVRVKSAAVSFVDFIMMTGQYQHRASPPYVPGLEFSGEIAWAGSGVRSLSVGDRVMSDFMTVGPRSKGEYQQSGAWSSFVVAPEAGVLALPPGFSYPQGCSFLANSETAYFALVKRANLRPGERVLITGASGASGMAMVQIAKILGAEVFVTGRARSKLNAVVAAGADHAIELDTSDPTALPATLRREIEALTDGAGVDAVIDTVGGITGYAAFRTLKFEGRFVIVGWASNVSQSGGRQTFEPDRLPTNIMQMKCLQVMGSPMVIYSMGNPGWRNKQKDQVLAWAKEGRLQPQVSHEFPVKEFRSAARAKFGGEVVGSCVLNF
ncbi:MAG: zinc-binding dehydrogenase [Pseudomonadota bacterium]